MLFIRSLAPLKHGLLARWYDSTVKKKEKTTIATNNLNIENENRLKENMILYQKNIEIFTKNKNRDIHNLK